MRLLSNLIKLGTKSKMGSVRYSSKSDWLPVSFIPQNPFPTSTWAVRKVLNSHSESVLEYLGLFINRSISCSKNLRVGSKGSLAVCTEEDKEGLWYNFESGEHGDMLDLIVRTKGISEEDALQIARTLLTQEHQDIVLRPKEEEKSSRTVNMAEFVQKILSGCTPIQGTLAEKYLRETRRLANIPGNNVLFHPRLSTKTKEEEYIQVPGLVVVAKHPQSQSINIQVTYLDPDTAGKHKDTLVSRRTFGSFGTEGSFHHCTLCKFSFDTTYISEGIETGLSLFQVRPESHIIATLGKNNFTKLDPGSLNRKVVLVWDNDGLDVSKDKVLKNTVKRLSNYCESLYLLLPPRIQGYEKTDLNDVLVLLGENAVNNVLQDCLKKIQITKE